MNILVSQSLFDYALMKPLSSSYKLDRLCIVSGYATHAMAARHLIETTKTGYNLNVDLIYGMAGTEGVRKTNHLGFLSLIEHNEFQYNGSFDCSYVKKPRSVHSKVYVWCKENRPVMAFAGSANYSESGFSCSSRIETLVECDPVSAYDFFIETKKHTQSCKDVDRLDVYTKISHNKSALRQQTSQSITIENDKNSPFYGNEKISLSLLTNKGDTGNGSRLNWGVRPDGRPRESKGKNGKLSFRNPNQSYIGLPVQFQKCGFFPDVGQHFTVLTDDNKIFTCVRAQANGKGIETPQDNSEIGRYMRHRLGLGDGAYISVSDLEKYGRFDVVFYKLDNENYVMDFSRPSN